MRAWTGRLYRDVAARAARAGNAWARRAIDFVHLCVVLGREAGRDQLGVRAAMLAYWTAMAAVPLLLLAFALTGPLGLTEETRSAVRTLLYDTVLAQSVEEVGQVLDHLLEGTSLRTFGIVGVAGLLITGAQLFFKIEFAYNDIFDNRIRRSTALRFVVFYAGLTLGPLVLSWGILVTAGSGRHDLFSWLLPPILTASVFIGALRLLPNTRVSWRAALAGGLLTTILFELAKRGFGIYATVFGAQNVMARTFGSVAFLPFSLLWMYVVWWVVLFGVELAYVTQHYQRLLSAQRQAAADPDGPRRQPDGFFALSLMALLAEWYREGRGPISVDTLASRCTTDPHVVQATLDVMEDAGLIVQNRECGYVPARPTSQVLASEVLRTWRERAAVHIEGGDTTTRAVKAQLAAVEAELAMSLDDLGAEAVEGKSP